MSAEPSSLLVGEKLGPYRVEVLLGEGAMGEVYRGVHEALGRPVAIKTLKAAIASDASLLERFFAEARAVNIIRHENIVECTDMVNAPGGRSYIVMELLEGRTLAGAMREVGRVPERRAVRIGAQIADAIAAAHDKGIVHRDLKPDNVFLIKRAGTTDYVKVLDFGIARLRPDYGITATQSGALIGTPAYMSPEQAKGERAGPAADVYALGIIMFHMIAGRLPFAASSLPLMLMAHVSETPRRLDALVPGVPAALADAVEQALRKEPERRQASMAAFRAQILGAIGLPVELTASVLAVPSAVHGVAVPTPSAVQAARSSSPPPSSSPAFEKTFASGAEGEAEAAAAEIPKTLGGSSLSGAAGEQSGGPGSVQRPIRKRRLPLIAGALVLAGGAAIAAIVAGGGDGKKDGQPNQPPTQSAAAVHEPPAMTAPDAGPAPVAVTQPAVTATAPDAGVAATVVTPPVKGAKTTRKPPIKKPPPVVDADKKPPPVEADKKPPPKKDLTKDLVDDPKQ